MGHVTRRAPLAVLVATAVFAGTAGASAAQNVNPVLARVDALAAMARSNVGLLEIINQLTRDAFAAHPALRVLGDRVVAHDKAMIAGNTAIVRDDARIKLDEQKIRVDQEQLKTAPPDKAAGLASSIAQLAHGVAEGTGAVKQQANDLESDAKRQQASAQQLADLIKAINAQQARLISQLTNGVSDNTSRMQQIARLIAARNV
jgi:ribosomal protein L29